jgi:hypothetical protein
MPQPFLLGKQQLIVNAFAKALEIIPQQLCDNAGCVFEFLKCIPISLLDQRPGTTPPTS